MLKGVGIGAGYFAPFHYEAWNRLPQVKLQAIADLDLAKAEAIAKRFDLPGIYTDVANMLDREQPDFVDIITPPATHLPLLRLAAERGIAVICQKPLAPSLAEAKNMVEIADSAGIRLMVHENFRFQPWYRQIHNLLSSGTLGEKVHHLHFRMRTGDGWPADAYQARQPYFRTMPRLLIYETGIHFIDTFRYLLGEVTEVYAKLRKFNPGIAGEDAAWVCFDFAGGVTAIFDANRYNESQAEDPRYTFGELLLETDQGSLRLDPDGRLTWQGLGLPERDIAYPHKKVNFGGDCVFFTQQHFAEALIAGTPFETDGTSYLTNLRIQEAIYQSDQLKRPVACT